MLRQSWFCSSALLVLAVLTLPTAARAEDRVPMRLRYVGAFPPPQIITFEPLVAFTTDQLGGVGTHVGQFTGLYPHTLNFDQGTFSGMATITAANGDLLSIDLGGPGSRSRQRCSPSTCRGPSPVAPAALWRRPER